MKHTSMDLNKVTVPLFKTLDEIETTAANWRIKKYELAEASGISKTTLVNWQHEALTDDRAAVLNAGLRKLIADRKKVLTAAHD